MNKFNRNNPFDLLEDGNPRSPSIKENKGIKGRYLQECNTNICNCKKENIFDRIKKLEENQKLINQYLGIDIVDKAIEKVLGKDPIQIDFLPDSAKWFEE